MRTIGRAFVLAVAFSVVTPVLPQSAHLASIKLEQVGRALSVRVRAEVKNVSGQPIDPLRGAASRDFAVTVISPDGKPAKPSQEAQRLRSLAPNGSQVLVTLPPQQSISYEWDLSDDFDFAQRGTYRATVARKVETINEIDTSNTIEIKQP